MPFSPDLPRYAAILVRSLPIMVLVLALIGRRQARRAGRSLDHPGFTPNGTGYLYCPDRRPGDAWLVDQTTRDAITRLEEILAQFGFGLVIAGSLLLLSVSNALGVDPLADPAWWLGALAASLVPYMLLSWIRRRLISRLLTSSPMAKDPLLLTKAWDNSPNRASRLELISYLLLLILALVASLIAAQDPGARGYDGLAVILLLLVAYHGYLTCLKWKHPT